MVALIAAKTVPIWLISYKYPLCGNSGIRFVLNGFVDNFIRLFP
jgi:hypothetical protein